MTQFNWGGQELIAAMWEPEIGVIGTRLALDTETTLIEDGKVPDFVIGQAYAGGKNIYLLRADTVKHFLETHQTATIVMHNAPFDTSVLTKETGFDFDTMIRSQRLWDTSILFRLLQLATVGKTPRKYNLALLSESILGIQMDKSMEVRGAFGKYRNGLVVDYASMTKTELIYAAIDPLATLCIFESIFPVVEQLSPQKYLSHKIQLMGAIALAEMTRNGICIDLEQRKKFMTDQDLRIEEAKNELSKFEFFPGKAGNQKRAIKLIEQFNIDLPRTPTGKPSFKDEHLAPHRAAHPFIDAYLTFKSEEKLKSFVVKLDQPKIHTTFNGIMNTGRTSSERPNLQNLPKDERIRRLFIPAPGHAFIIGDYQQLELCTLAQVCLDRYGVSRMADLINDGTDLHRWFAGVITGKEKDQVTDEERKYAKACNFGFPGGLGPRAFVEYAAKSYKVELSETRAAELRNHWINAFPEMQFYLEDNLILRHNFRSLEWCSDPMIAIALFKRIARGESYKANGQPYSTETIKWALKTVLSDLAPEYAGIERGSPEILKAALQESVVTRTGRIRANTDYCAARNTPFQGLAADGAKIAIYRLRREGIAGANFIHDEIISQVPISSAVDELLKKQQQIMEDAMKAVVPGVAIRAKVIVSDHWAKP